ncbi:hypothetical protein [Photobacterium leiognathi]|uniref:hypothetical protein n=1 Tax=Photobacterium leiognathi TaxID=553611 RepID=UPI002981D726|nr:hypothetical protein [Photobacterium leiognathi]
MKEKALKKTSFTWLAIPSIGIFVLAVDAIYADKPSTAMIGCVIALVLSLVTAIKGFGCGNRLMPFATEIESRIYKDYRFYYLILAVGVFLESTTLTGGLISLYAGQAVVDKWVLEIIPFAWFMATVKYCALLICFIATWCIIDVFSDNTKERNEPTLEELLK